MNNVTSEYKQIPACSSASGYFSSTKLSSYIVNSYYFNNLSKTYWTYSFILREINQITHVFVYRRYL